MVYLDNSATTPVCPTALRRMTAALTEHFGNPSSLHALGASAENLIETARGPIAEKWGCDPAQIIFTSGGTEANNTAIFSAAETLRRRGGHIVAAAIEHDSVLSPLKTLAGRGYEVTLVPPREDGVMLAGELSAAVRPDTILVCLMLANNETGAVQPVAEAAGAVRRVAPHAWMHCDAVQAFGKMDFSVTALDIDSCSISAHKIHGPKGAGALYVAKSKRLIPLLHGGGQERGLRPGTQGVPAIAGFGGAAEELPPLIEASAKMSALLRRLTDGVKAIPAVTVLPVGNPLPYMLGLAMPGVKSEILLHFLESRDIYVSSGSACSRGKPSHVLTAQGLPPAVVDSAVRVSLSRYNTPGDVDALLEGLEAAAKRFLSTA